MRAFADRIEELYLTEKNSYLREYLKENLSVDLLEQRFKPQRKIIF